MSLPTFHPRRRQYADPTVRDESGGRGPSTPSSFRDRVPAPDLTFAALLAVEALAAVRAVQFYRRVAA